MSETFVNLLQWLVLLVFFTLGLGAMVAEAAWLSKKGWANFGKSFAFSALSNFIGFFIGLGAFFIVLAVFMMLALDGSLSTASTAKTALGAAIFVFSAFLTPILLIIGKRIFLAVLKIQTGKAAWLYAVVSSVLIFVIVLGVPSMCGYFLFS